MTNLVYAIGFIFFVVGFVFWPLKRHSNAATISLAVGALLMWLAAWAVCGFVAQLPTSAVETGNKAVGHLPKIIAVDGDYAYIYNKDIYRIRLSDGRIVQKYADPNIHDALLRLDSIAWHDGFLMFTFTTHRGALGDVGYAVLNASSWVVRPKIRKQTDPMKQGVHQKAYWDAVEEKFVLASFRFGRAEQKGEQSFFVQRIDRVLIDPVAKEPDARIIAASPVVVEVPGVNTVGGLEGLCRIKGNYFASDFVMRAYKLKPKKNGRFGLEKLFDGAPKTARCAGDLKSDIFRAPARYLYSGGTLELPLPLTSSGNKEEPLLIYNHSRIEENEVHPSIVILDDDYGRVFLLSDNSSLSWMYLSPEEARNLGFVDAVIQITRWAPSGKKEATRYLRATVHSFDNTVMETGDHIVALSSDFYHMATFDKTTLRRLDPPSTLSAVSDRLDDWGGPSQLFNITLGFTLLAGIVVLLWVMVALIMPKIQQTAMLSKITVQRVALTYCAMAAPTLMTLIRSTWHL